MRQPQADHGQKQKTSGRAQPGDLTQRPITEADMGVDAARFRCPCIFDWSNPMYPASMPTGRESPLAVVPPPFLYLATFLIGMSAHGLWPWGPAWMHSIVALGRALLVIGVLLAPGNALLFLAERTTINPAARPTKLITQGAYRFSRNPMYVGISLIYAGASIILGSLWPLILLPIPMLVMNAVVIPMEEANAREAFGEQYMAYCRSVRRWL
jgi:protein-S-isoprenylcysteine O-methyltransferase Ste14